MRRINNIRNNRERRERKTMIIGSSLVKSLENNKDNLNEQLKFGSTQTHTFRGKTAEYITKYMVPHLEEECPHTVVFVAGGNDIPRRRATEKELRTIANHLIEGGRKCKENFGVSKVSISSILPRVFGVFQGNRHVLNRILEELCAENDIGFIDNGNIAQDKHIGYDGVHLNKAGGLVFTDNIVSHLNA